MFVLEALVLTFATTPLVTWMYPPHVRKHVAATGANFDAVAGDAEHKHRPSVGSGSTDASTKKDFMVVIDRTEVMSAQASLSICLLTILSFSSTFPPSWPYRSSSNRHSRHQTAHHPTESRPRTIRISPFSAYVSWSYPTVHPPS